MGSVTSISPVKDGTMYCGTSESVIYFVDKDLKPSIITSCHKTRINDICYPKYNKIIPQFE